MENNKILIVLIALALISITLVSAERPMIIIEIYNHSRLDSLNWSVAGHTFDADLLPSDTLTYDIGSGALRWRNIYGTNLSIDNIDAIGNITTTENFIGSGAFLTNLNVSGNYTGYLPYLNLSGTNANQNVNISPYDFLSAGIILNDGGCLDFGNRATSICESGTGDIDIKSEGRIDVWTDTEISLRVDGDVNDYFHIETNDDIPTLRSYLSNMKLSPDEGLVTVTGNLTIMGNTITAQINSSFFNWTSADDWNIFDGSTLDFNESKLDIIYYNATSVDVVVGTLDDGDVESTWVFGGESLNVSEANAEPGLDLRINFTGVSDFNQLILRYKTSPDKDHETNIELWDWVNGVWEDHDFYIESEHWDNPYIPIWDSSLHIGTGANAGEVNIRIYMEERGKSTHIHYFDFVQLSLGTGTFASNEVDPLSYHKNANINAENYNATFDVGNFSTLYAGNVSVSEVLQDFDSNAYAKYQFTDNNFNGSGDFTGGTGRFTTLGINTSAPPLTSGLLRAINDAIETTTGYVGFVNQHQKTAGITDGGDGFTSFFNFLNLDQSGGVIGRVYQIYNDFTITEGETLGIYGMYNIVDLRDGKVGGDLNGIYTSLDQAATNEVTGSIYGHQIKIDADGTVGGTVYGLYLDEGSNIDYGIYQDGSADNYFGGDIVTSEVRAPNASGLKLYEDGGQGIFVEDGGFVGINNTNPINLLHIQYSAVPGADSHVDDLLVLERNANANFNFIVSNTGNAGFLFSDSTRAVGVLRYNHGIDAMEFRTASVWHMTLDSTGNLILDGTSGTHLSLDGDADGQPYLYFLQNNVGKAYIQYIDAGAGTDYLQYDAPKHSFTTGGIHMTGMKSGTDQANAGADAGELYFDTNDDNTVKMGV